MSAASGVAAPAAGGAQATEGSSWGSMISKGLLFYFALNAGTSMLKQVLGPKEAANPNPSESLANPSDAAKVAGQAPFEINQGAGSGFPPLQVMRNASSRPIWKPRDELDFYVLLSWHPAPSEEDIATQYSPLVPGGATDLPPLEGLIDFSSYPSLQSDASSKTRSTMFTVVQSSDRQKFPLLKAENVSLSDISLSADLSLTLPNEVMLYNGSIWADLVAVKSGADIRDSRAQARQRRMLTRLMPPRKNREGRKLLAGATSSSEEPQLTQRPPANSSSEEDRRWITYWHSNLTIALPKQDAQTGLAVGQLPAPLLQYIHLVRDEEDGKSLLYSRTADGNPSPSWLYNYPIIFPNTFWDMKEDMNPINATTPVLPLSISVSTTSWFKFQLLAAMGDSFDKSPGGAGGELDIVKHTLLHTSPYYLLLVVVVTILHMVFEFLAFSSDVSFWRKQDNLAGISVGSIMTSIVTQTIILLYLIDSSEETSWMILGSQAMGVAVEAWKLTKALTVNIKPAPAGSLIPYRLDVQDKHVLSKEELETKEHDRLAFKIVAIGCAPLLVAYTVYSALYQEHRGWWSFIIGTLCSFTYTFGFVSLIPQLIVNHKMKSVAGMNAKTLIYKIISTFVDDLFAFSITKMPLMHRLATLRDDVVFFVLLGQMYYFGVDKTRVNEFGQVLEPTEEMLRRGGLTQGKKSEVADKSPPASAAGAAVAEGGDGKENKKDQ